MSKKKNPIVNKVHSELSQNPETRTHLYKNIQSLLGRPVISYFTSFRHSVLIDDSDADIIDGMLQSLDLSNGLAVIISSPGGYGIAAERIINIFRSYSGTGEFKAIVPSKAKSAATMICLGASEIMMGSASELGPVDPQVTMEKNGNRKSIAAFHIVKGYETLFNNAIKEKGNLDPYLIQLGKYDFSEINDLKSAIDLSKDISIKALNSGMMEGLSDREIEEKIKILLTPEDTKTHGRSIFRDAAKEIGLKITDIDHTSELWENVYEIYLRLKSVTERPNVCKVIETIDYTFNMNA